MIIDLRQGLGAMNSRVRILDMEGEVWIRDDSGQLRLLRVGESLSTDAVVSATQAATLVLEGDPALRLNLMTTDGVLVSRLLSESPSPSDSGDFYRGPDDDTPLGEGDFSRTGEEIGDETLNELLAELEENPPQAGSSSSAGGSGNEGHGFVRLLRIFENVYPLAFNFTLADEVGI